MSKILPQSLIDVVRTFNDFALDTAGIICNLYVPINLNAVESKDMYLTPTDVIYKAYNSIPVWFEFFPKDLHKLRKLGIFAENETPMLARFKLQPEVTINSYIEVDTRYVPDKFDTDKFEVVDIIMTNLYDSEIYRYCKMAPFRKKK